MTMPFKLLDIKDNLKGKMLCWPFSLLKLTSCELFLITMPSITAVILNINYNIIINYI